LLLQLLKELWSSTLTRDNKQTQKIEMRQQGKYFNSLNQTMRRDVIPIQQQIDECS